MRPTLSIRFKGQTVRRGNEWNPVAPVGVTEVLYDVAGSPCQYRRSLRSVIAQMVHLIEGFECTNV